MKPFNLEQALAGAPVVTRDGRVVTELAHFKTLEEAYSLRAVVDGGMLSFTPEGKFHVSGSEHHTDLFMGPTKKGGWVNLYRGVQHGYFVGHNVYETEEAAVAARGRGIGPQKPLYIEWEE